MGVKKWLHIIAFTLVIIGALNLGLFGIVPPNADSEGFSLLQNLFGFSDDLLDFIYILIGVSGIYLVATHLKECRTCDHKGASKKGQMSAES